MDMLVQDLRFALRSLRRTPGFTAVVVAVMALGIGVNVAMFSMVYGIALRPWPLPDPGRLVDVRTTNPRTGWYNMPMSWPNYADLRDRSKSFSAIGAYWSTTGTVTIDHDPERLAGARITAGLFPALGVPPMLGRNFTRDEEIQGRDLDQVIVSERLWRTRLGGTPAALGRTIRVNGRTRAIVGVMPKGFRFPETEDFWIPASRDPANTDRLNRSLEVLARLGPGVSSGQAAAEMEALWGALVHDHAELKDFGIRVLGSQRNSTRSARPMLVIVLVAVFCVLIVACANVANLLLARAANRRREISVRIALGASRGRIVRQLLTESVLLSGIGGALGIAIGYWGNAAWQRGIPVEMPAMTRFTIDGPVLLYTAALTALAGVVFGLAPALHASDTGLTQALREGGIQAGHSRSGRRLRNSLVVAEIAFSIVLLIGAGLMVRSFKKCDQAGRGLRTKDIVVGRMFPPAALYPTEQQRAGFFRELQQRLQREPGVVSVSLISDLPLGKFDHEAGVMTPDTPDARSAPSVSYWATMPGALKTLGIPLRRGREFTFADDSAGMRVALVSEEAARRLYPGRDAIGQRIRCADDPDSLGWRTIVGVTADIVQNVDFDARVIGSIWVPELQEPVQIMWALVESRGAGEQGAATLRRTVHSLDPDIAVYDVRTLHEQLQFSLWVRRLFASLVGVFGVLALLIAAVGLYGVMAYSVAQRTREIGVRMALGAEPAGVMKLVMGQALRMTAIGIGIGLAVAAVVARFLGSIASGVSPTDPPTYAAVTILLALSGVLAAWVPAWRATRMSPALALRGD
jgi:putative ABC transport system permease protein